MYSLLNSTLHFFVLTSRIGPYLLTLLLFSLSPPPPASPPFSSYMLTSQIPPYLQTLNPRPRVLSESSSPFAAHPPSFLSHSLSTTALCIEAGIDVQTNINDRLHDSFTSMKRAQLHSNTISPQIEILLSFSYKFTSK